MVSQESIANPNRAVEPESVLIRQDADQFEPKSIRTYSPSRAVISTSAGSWHWTPEGRKLLDYTSGVLVANLGHNPTDWMQRFCDYMSWTPQILDSHSTAHSGDFLRAVPFTTYNAITELETQASSRLIDLLRTTPFGSQMEQVLWAASGSEAIQKALWAAMSHDRTRPMILATRYGFHGKKGLSNAVTGSEHDAERDPRVKFISFPMADYRDVTCRDVSFNQQPYHAELEALLHQYGQRIGTLITEPYLGGGGSYHPPVDYLQFLSRFCKEHGIVFILDEVQANFGRTGSMFAFEKYNITPDLVVLGKGLGNGMPVAAVAGSRSILSSLGYGEASDTWSANPLSAASVLATLDCFNSRNILGPMHKVSEQLEAGLIELKQYPFIANVRGEQRGMVWGIEMKDYSGRTASDWANDFVLRAYQGHGRNSTGVHLLGPLAKKVVRVSPPLVITSDEVEQGRQILRHAAESLLHSPTHV
jgi:4-aminobutyrate aminotransferase-like enzyme